MRTYVYGICSDATMGLFEVKGTPEDLEYTKFEDINRVKVRKLQYTVARKVVAWKDLCPASWCTNSRSRSVVIGYVVAYRLAPKEKTQLLRKLGAYPIQDENLPFKFTVKDIQEIVAGDAKIQPIGITC